MKPGQPKKNGRLLSRRGFAIFGTVAIASALAGCSPSGSKAEQKMKEQAYTAGTYEASSTGRNGMVKLEAMFDSNRITDIKILESSETAVIGDAAFKIIPQKIIDNQSLNIDTVSGATYTSTAIISAMKDAVTQAGGDPREMTATPLTEGEAADAETDIVVIGSGGSGMMAALEATSKGASVILIEKQGYLGAGDTVHISTGIAGGGSTQFESKGVEQYSIDEFYQQLDAQAIKKNLPVNRTNLRAYAEKSGEVIDYFIESGVPLSKYDKGRLMYLTDDGSAPGTHIAKALAEQVEKTGIDYRLNTKALSLVVDGERVVGVQVEAPAGEYTINAKAVILATGGFSNNEDLLSEYNPTWVGRPTTGAISLTGDGQVMSREIGADLTCMDQVKANYLCHVLPTGDGASLTAVAPYCVIVNHEGKRFMDESDASITHKSVLMMSQTKQEGYAIFDQSVVDDLKIIQGYNKVGYFESEDTIEALAKRIDVSADNFVSSIAAFQDGAKNGTDGEFGREINNTLSNPKYYSALITPSMQSTYGGTLVDAEGRALSNTNHEVVPGLYAAGSVSGHECYANEVGYASIIAFTYGKISADAAVADLSK